MPDPAQPRAVFLSYAREDADAARRVAEALRSQGVEAWLDQSELRGGDAWDATIRRQIRDCALFLPLISAHTQARSEGYFRREWKLGVERTHDMAASRTFIVPVAVDETSEAEAEVPDEFMRVQWTRLPGGLPTADFVADVKKLLGGGAPRRALREARAAAADGAAVLPAEKSVAVLAFANLSSDPENEYFSDGISEELLNVLAKVPGLRITARTSSFFFKGKNVPVPEIAQRLGVSHLVEGSVRKLGSRVRITAQLIEARDGFHLWSETFDRELKDIFALQDEIAGLIARNLQLKLSAGGQEAKPVNPEAHRLVLEGRYFWNLRTELGFARAEKAFQRAIEVAPEFATAYSGLADVKAVRAWYMGAAGLSAARSEAMQAIAPAEKAMRLDPALASAYATPAVVAYLEGRFEESERLYQQAFRLNPNFALAFHWHSHLLAVRGRLAESLADLERSISLDPLATVTTVIYACHLVFARRYQDALAATDHALSLGPSLGAPIQGARAMAFLALGQNEEAIAAARLVGQEPSLHMRWWSGEEALYVMRRIGAPGEAERQYDAWRTAIPEDTPAHGPLLHALGRFDEALPYLRKSPPPSFARMYYHTIWDDVRADARFDDVIRHLKCEQEYRLGRQDLSRLMAGAKTS